MPLSFRLPALVFGDKFVGFVGFAREVTRPFPSTLPGVQCTEPRSVAAVGLGSPKAFWAASRIHFKTEFLSFRVFVLFLVFVLFSRLLFFLWF